MRRLGSVTLVARVLAPRLGGMAPSLGISGYHQNHYEFEEEERKKSGKPYRRSDRHVPGETAYDPQAFIVGFGASVCLIVWCLSHGENKRRIERQACVVRTNAVAVERDIVLLEEELGSRAGTPTPR